MNLALLFAFFVASVAIVKGQNFCRAGPGGCGIDQFCTRNEFVRIDGVCSKRSSEGTMPWVLGDYRDDCAFDVPLFGRGRRLEGWGKVAPKGGSNLKWWNIHS